MQGELGTKKNPVLLDFAVFGVTEAEPGREASAALKLPISGNVVAGLGLVALAAFLLTR